MFNHEVNPWHCIEWAASGRYGLALGEDGSIDSFNRVGMAIGWACGIFRKSNENQKKIARAACPGQRVIPGGVDSPVRAFKSVGGEPLPVVRGKGRVWDADGNDYIDYIRLVGAVDSGAYVSQRGCSRGEGQPRWRKFWRVHSG